MNKDTKQTLWEQGIIEEGFEQVSDKPDRFVLKTKGSMSVYGIGVSAGLLLLLFIILQQRHWYILTRKDLGVLTFFGFLTLVTFALGGMPQRLLIERGSSKWFIREVPRDSTTERRGPLAPNPGGSD